MEQRSRRRVSSHLAASFAGTAKGAQERPWHAQEERPGHRCACAGRVRLSTPAACDQGELVWRDERQVSDVFWVLVGCVVTAVTWATHRRPGALTTC